MQVSTIVTHPLRDMNTPPTQAPSARSRRRRSSPWWSRPSVQAVSPRPSPVPSRPAGRMRPEGPTRGSGVSSPPRPTMPASPGCRRHRWTPPNTSRPWSGSRSFHGAADGVLLSSGYVRQSEDRLCEPRSPRLDHRRCWMTQLMPSWQRPGHPGSGIAGLWWTSPWSWCCGAVVFARSEAAVPVRPDPAPSGVQHNHEVELQLIGEVGVEQQPPQR